MSMGSDQTDEFENGGDGADEHDEEAKDNDGHVGHSWSGKKRSTAKQKQKEWRTDEGGDGSGYRT